jgi:uroporphyrinogen-III synthase
MASVLLTRPLSSSLRTQQALARRGVASVIEPLLNIVPLTTPRPQSLCDALMLTSANALYALQDRMQEIEPYDDRPCFCVGPATADMAREAGFRRVYYTAADGAALAEAIAAALPPGSSILHPAARDIDAKAQRALTAQGYAVTIWPVYAAIAATSLSPAICADLAHRRLDSVALYSARTARILLDLIHTQGLESDAGHLVAVGLSAAVTDVLSSFLWRGLATAAEPSEDAMLAVLTAPNAAA